MCATLTENVVLVRTRSHDLKMVKKLNCWGCALKDVSIVHRMPNVEVISLSINSIESLSDFAACSKLQELYLRKNEIKDINHVMYLTQLEELKKLSLEDNPCTQTDNYRLTVVKALPNLEYLDNLRVTSDEIYEAEKYGSDLYWPGSTSAQEQEELQQQQQQLEILSNSNHHQNGQNTNNNNSNNVGNLINNTNNHNHSSNSRENSNSTSSMNNNVHREHSNTHLHGSSTNISSSAANQGHVNQTEYSTSGRQASQQSLSNISNSSNNESGYCQSNDESSSSYTIHSNVPNSGQQRPSTASHGHGVYTQQSGSQSNQTNPQHNQQTPASTQSHCLNQNFSNMNINNSNQIRQESNQPLPGTPKKTNMSKCTSMSDYTLYNNGNGNGQYRPMSPTQSEYNFDTETVESGIASHRHSAQFDNPVNYRQGHLRSGSMSTQNRFLPKGGRNRNANILSAVLCLIKELDYASLEVVDTTIHCRMEEMED